MISRKIIDNLLTEEEMLLEMAYKLSKIVETIDKQAQDKCLDHLVLCFVYGKKYKDTRHHWSSEICAFMPRCWKDSNTNKFPDKEILLNKCYYTWSDCLDKWIPAILKDFSVEYGDIPLYDIDNVKSAIAEYYDWAFSIFSTDGKLVSKDVSNKIEELYQKYIGD